MIDGPEYQPVPHPLPEDARSPILRAAQRNHSPSLMALLDHIAYLEQESAGIRHLLYEEVLARHQSLCIPMLQRIAEERAQEISTAYAVAMAAPAPIVVFNVDAPQGEKFTIIARSPRLLESAQEREVLR